MITRLEILHATRVEADGTVRWWVWLRRIEGGEVRSGMRFKDLSGNVWTIGNISTFPARMLKIYPGGRFYSVLPANMARDLEVGDILTEESS